MKARVLALAALAADAVLLGMGERIDATVMRGGDVIPFVARAEGKGKDAGPGRAVIAGARVQRFRAQSGQ